MSIFGVDIASGSPAARRTPSYSLVILEGDSIASFHMISRHKLIRLIRERQPEMVAMDNLHELASGRRELIEILRRVPSQTRMVQVTGADHPEPLVKLARYHGITFDRTKPLQEAEACARLAARGVGVVLSAFQERTWIKVSRRRSLGRGGWSQNRYTRKIHGAVMGLAREVEQQLRESGLPYTSRAVQGLGGYTRAEFVVEAPRDRVHINPGYCSDAQLLVQSMERPELLYRPLVQRRSYIIVGLDPGTTTGIAALTLSGALVDLISSRAMSSSDVIEWIAARGRPLMVATDVFPTPGAVEKVKRAFNAVLYSPGADVPAEEKIALARPFGYNNDHERDALAAAASAFKKYKNKFLQVERKAPSDINVDEVKALVARGYSIENAIAEFVPIHAADSAPAAPSGRPGGADGTGPALAGSPSQDGTVALRQAKLQLSEQLRTVRSYLDELRAALEEKDAALSSAQARLERLQDRTAREIKRQHEIKIRDKEIIRLRSILKGERKYIKKLKKSLAREKKVQAIEDTQGLLRLRPLEAFTREAVLHAAEQGLSGGDYVYLEQASGGGRGTAESLSQRGIAGVVVKEEMAAALREHFLDLGVAVYSGRDVPVRMINGMPFARPEQVEAARAAWEEESIARRARLEAERLEGLFEEYRVERKKEEKRKKKAGPVPSSGGAAWMTDDG